MSTDTLERKGERKLYSNFKRMVYDSRPAGGRGRWAGAILAYFRFNEGFLIINNSCSGKKNVRLLLFSLLNFTLSFQERADGLGNGGVQSIFSFIDFPFFIYLFFKVNSKAKRQEAVAVRRSLNKNGEASGTRARCRIRNNRFFFLLHSGGGGLLTQDSGSIAST